MASQLSVSIFSFQEIHTFIFLNLFHTFFFIYNFLEMNIGRLTEVSNSSGLKENMSLLVFGVYHQHLHEQSF